MAVASQNVSSLIPYGDSKHPASILVATFLAHVGSDGHSWVQSKTGISWNDPWCAATCCAVAKECGFAGINMPGDDWGAGTFGGQIAGRPDVSHYYGGTRIMGPKYDNPAVPVPGDFILFQWNEPEGWVCDHIGVVRKVDDSYVYTVEGNTEGTLKEQSYRIGNTCIAWYARPDWTKVGGQMPVPGVSYPDVNLSSKIISQGVTADGESESTQFNLPLFSTENTKEDAIIREVCYITNSAKPSINKTGARLSLINFTGMLSKMYELGSGYSNSGSSGLEKVSVSTDNIDSLDPVGREIVSFFRSWDFTTAVGIAVYVISGDPERDGTAVGLLGWPKSRGSSMKQMCGGGDSYKTNLTGQLKFMLSELNSSYTSLLSTLRNIPNTKAGCTSAVTLILGQYLNITSPKSYLDSKVSKASECWDSIILASTNGLGETNYTAQTSIVMMSGKQVNSGTAVSIPTTVNQTGIIPNYTNYSYFRSRWSNYTIQKQLADIWDSQGRPESNKVATISGYYLVATTLTFGTTGDAISVVLEDGTYFNAIIADSKGGGNDAAGETNIWGHYMGDGSSMDIIEWEATGPTDSNYTDQSALRDALLQAGFLGKKVSKIVNYGSWVKG